MTQKQRQEYQKLQVYLWALGQENWPLEGINKQDVLAQVIKAAQYPEINLDPTAEQFLPTFNRKIFELLSVPGDLPVSNIPPLEILKTDVESEIQKREEKVLKLVFPTLDQQIKNLYKNLKEKVSEELIKTEPALAQNPLLKETISGKVATELISQTPQGVQKQSFSQEESEKIIENIKPVVSEEFKKIGFDETKIINDKDFSKRLNETTFESSQSISITPRHTVDIEKVIAAEKPTEPIGEIPPLPKEILQKINQTPENINNSLIYSALNPKAGLALTQKIISSPQAGLIRMAIENAPPEWQADKNWAAVKEIVQKGIFVEDLKTSAKTFKEMGLKETHPLIKKLEDKIFLFENAQKDPLTGKDFRWVKILKKNLYWNNLLGRKIQDQTLLKGGYYPQLAVQPDWKQPGSYASSLKSGLNRLQFISNTSQRFMKFVTGGKYESVGVFVRKAVYQKTIKPILVKLGKTAAGKAVKEGAKKISIWAATKLGVQLGSKGLAAALGPETMGISILISLAIDAAMFILNMIKRGISYLRRAWFEMSESPEKAITYLFLGGAILIPVLIPGFLAFAPFLAPILTVIGVPLAATGGAALLTGSLKAFSIGSAATALSTQTAATVAATGGNVVLGSVFGAGVGALIITQITSSAFIVPEVETLNSSYIDVSKTVDIKKIESNNDLPLDVTYTISISAAGETINNIKVFNNNTVTNENGAFSISEDKDGESIITFSIPSELGPGESWSGSYTLHLNPEQFKNSRIVDILTATADVPSLGLTNELSHAFAEVRIGSPPSGPTFDCEGSGKEINLQAGGYNVEKILLSGAGRTGRCIIPTMIVIHWSAGTSNYSTRITLDGKGSACHLGTDTNGSVEQWQQFWEKMVERPICGHSSNAYGIQNEMVGAYFGKTESEFEGVWKSWYGGPPDDEFKSAVESCCWMMKQYNISVDNIWGHHNFTDTKIDVGDEFLEKLRNAVRNKCPGAGG